MKLFGWGMTDKGRRRSGNQDTFLVDEDLALFVVADGMGGHKGGEVASEMAIGYARETFLKSIQANEQLSPRELIQKMYEAASNAVFDKGRAEIKLKGMGTTMVLILRSGKHLYIGNVGDSRCYFQSGMDLWQISEDHSLVYEQMREGLIKEEQLDTVEGRNIITRSVGFERDVICDVFERELVPGDRFVMCSDGLSGMLSNRRINEICLSCRPDEWPERMIKEANDAGGDDNITVVSVVVGE